MKRLAAIPFALLWCAFCLPSAMAGGILIHSGTIAFGTAYHWSAKYSYITRSQDTFSLKSHGKVIWISYLRQPAPKHEFFVAISREIRGRLSMVEAGPVSSGAKGHSMIVKRMGVHGLVKSVGHQTGTYFVTYYHARTVYAQGSFRLVK